jgi:AraC family transcriptional regulator of adaptative response/methylated-DNA-[protein]-cysteine methyltransferase
LTLAHLAKRVHLSPAHLQRTFKAALGVSPKEYHDSVRMQRLKAGLKAGMSVLGAITDAGFQSTSRLYDQASRSRRNDAPR